MNYTPQVGDVARRPNWVDGHAIRVIAVDGESLFGRTESGMHSIWSTTQPWVKVTPRPTLPTMPDRWAGVHVNHTRNPVHASADEVLRGKEALAAVRYVAVPGSVVWADEAAS